MTGLSVATRQDVEVREMEDQRPTIALFIPSLGMGGAERQARCLASNLDPQKWRVLLLTQDDHLGGRKGIAGVRQLAAILRRERVDILQAFLLGAQVYALAAKVLYRRVKLVAAVRSSMGTDRIVGMKGKVSHRLLFGLERFVDHYVFNSSAGQRDVGRRLPALRKRVIANGIDTVTFHPDSAARNYLRRIADVAEDKRIVGIVANVNVDKGYETLVRAAGLVGREIGDVCFVAIGEYRNALGERIQGLISELSLTSQFRFLGARSDVERLVPGMDIAVSASTSEGFSNAIAEAMACGVPCVVTDVGDSALIAGDTGVVVTPGDPDALANGLRKLLTLDRDRLATLGALARNRIERSFGVQQLVQSYERLYESLLSLDRSA